MSTEFKAKHSPGFEIKLMVNPLMPKGKAALVVNPEDMPRFKPAPAPVQVKTNERSIFEQIIDAELNPIKLPTDPLTIDEVNELFSEIRKEILAKSNYTNLLKKMEADLWEIYNTVHRVQPHYCLVSNALKPVFKKSPTAMRDKMSFKTIFNIPVVWTDDLPAGTWQYVFKKPQNPVK